MLALFEVVRRIFYEQKKFEVTYTVTKIEVKMN